MRLNYIGLPVLAATVTLWTLGALAQDAASAPQQPRIIERMVVTATGKETPRDMHPGNIAQISAGEIDFVKPEQPAELLNRIPGIGIQQGSGVEHLTAIRSPVLTSGAGAGSFLYLEDGVPMRAAGSANVNELMEAMVEEAGGIEIVRGPGSALYGSNAVHGLINVLSKPTADIFEGEVSAIVGPHGVRNLDGTVNIPLSTDTLTHSAVRTSVALAQDADGFRANSGLDQAKAQIRYDYSRLGNSIRATFTAVNIQQETAGFVVGPSAYKNDALRKGNPNPEAYRDAWALRGAIRFEHEMQNGDKFSLTPYARVNAMNFLMHFQPGAPVEKNGHWSTGLLSRYYLSLANDNLILFGVDSEYTQSNLSEVQSSPTTLGTYVTGTHFDYDVNALVLAPYVHSVWHLGPATELTAGLRFEYTRYVYNNQTATGIAGRFLRPADSSDIYMDVTPKLGLTHKFSDQITGFINIARGARAPQTSDLYRLQSKQIPGQVNSEMLDSIEVGARGQWGTLAYEIAAYAMRKKNFYFRDADGFNVPDGRTKHFGIEAEVATPLIWGFDIAAAATYARHSYDFNNIQTIPSNSAESIRDGADVDTAPRTLSNFRLGYNFEDDRLRAELEWEHMGAYWMDAANTQRYPGHDIFNLRADYKFTEALGAFLKVSNLFDTRYADRADYMCTVASCQQRYFPGEDRALYLGATFSF
jgi:iron complex outermembrane receptor protein